MPWLKSVPLISIVLVMITYGVFGWSMAETTLPWVHLVHDQLHVFAWDVKEQTILIVIHGFALLAITIATLALTAPITLMTYFVGSWVQSEARSIISMVLWSFLFVVALRWFNYFINLFMLLSAAILGRMELRYTGLNQTVSLCLLTLICVGSFSGGVLSYFHWHPALLH